MFIPEDGYLYTRFDESLEKAKQNLSLDVDVVEALKTIGPADMQDVYITLHGQRMKIVDTQYVSDVIDEIRIWIQGFIYILLAFYHIDNLYKLIRGTSMIKPTPEPMNNIGFRVD